MGTGGCCDAPGRGRTGVESQSCRVWSRLSTEPAQPSALPALILLQRNPAIRQAWQEVAAAISENETLPDSERLPEPYFARAEIWATAGNYSDSLQDYLYGISIVRVSGRDLLSYSVQFDKLGDVADKLQKMPVPAAGAEPIYSSAARNTTVWAMVYFSGTTCGQLWNILTVRFSWPRTNRCTGISAL